MHHIHHILLLALMLTPIGTSALTFEAPDRELSLEEKKVGSVYRGCNGFHCLEEQSYIELAVETNVLACGPDHDMGLGPIDGTGYVCLTLGTNSREGLLVQVSGTAGTRACLEALSGGMERWHDAECAEAGDGTVLMRTGDSVESAFARIAVERGAPGGRVKFMTLVAY